MEKALSIWPEWAWAICNLGKNIENRTYPLPLRAKYESTLIHAGAKIGGGTKKGKEQSIQLLCDTAREAGWGVEDWPSCGEPSGFIFRKGNQIQGFSEYAIPLSAIVAIVDFRNFNNHENHVFAQEQESFPWAQRDACVHHWVIDRVKVLSKPIPAKGKLSFWQISADAEQKLKEDYFFKNYLLKKRM